jgi:hypothetical protein
MAGGYGAGADDLNNRDFLHGLQRMLELPVAIGRKVVQALAEVSPDMIEKLGSSSDKENVRERSRAIFQAVGAAEAFDELSDKNSEYTDIVQSRQRGCGCAISNRAYEDYLGKLYCTMPVAAEWVSIVNEKVLPMIKKSDENAPETFERSHGLAKDDGLQYYKKTHELF